MVGVAVIVAVAVSVGVGVTVAEAVGVGVAVVVGDGVEEGVVMRVAVEFTSGLGVLDGVDWGKTAGCSVCGVSGKLQEVNTTSVNSPTR
jgi:hypothetical protein